MNKKITIYTSPTCSHCDELKQWLDENEIEYEEKNVLTDDEARSYIVQKSQQLSVPVTIVGEGDDESMIIGFDGEKLSKELRITNDE